MGDGARVRQANDAQVRAGGRYVLYWMIGARRTRWSHALDHALAWCRRLGRPLLVLEGVQVDYPWASRRHHRFVLDGMVDNAAALDAAGVTYHPWVEPAPGASDGLLEALAADAAVVVTDEVPGFFQPKLVAAAATRLAVRLDVVDSNGVLPLSVHGRAFPTAAGFRRHLHKQVLHHLAHAPTPDPLRGYDLGRATLPRRVSTHWPAADLTALADGGLDRLPIDPLAPVAEVGGASSGERVMARFLVERLRRYADRNEPDADAASGLSPWLHFGHVSAEEIVHTVLRRDAWTPEQADALKAGSREGWWGLSPEAESFLDELITWRELGYGFCHHRDDYDRYESLPDWAQATLAHHAGDPRPKVYTLDQLDGARTHDPLWNAAQRQLRVDGRIHNYLRMLWGKKILEWSPSPREALDRLIHLNNRYATDGRDPNSYSGIFWTLGRFDRAWGPERPIYGTVRYMTSENTARKMSVRGYLRRWGPGV